MTQQIDTASAKELELTIENDSRVYPKRVAIEAMLRRKVDRQEYDHTKAPLAFLPFVNDGAKLYRKQFPGVQFNVATRLEVARQFAIGFEAQTKIELQAAKLGAMEEQNVTRQEYEATGEFRAFQRSQAADREAIRTVNVQAAFNTEMERAARMRANAAAVGAR